ncbi:MAG: hypothetical protein IT379_13890, partial [Deltaproteobacteria bacterium]|nr:hypothetical protein [Deltaproteobacteria bacterium]
MTELVRGVVATVVALGCAGCIAGPQPEPPLETDGGRGAGMTRDATPPAPPWVPEAGAPSPPDGGVARSDGGGPAGGWTGEQPPWADPDDSTDSRDDVAPFPFERCCGWFELPDGDGDPDAGTADGDAGA